MRILVMNYEYPPVGGGGGGKVCQQVTEGLRGEDTKSWFLPQIKEVFHRPKSPGILRSGGFGRCGNDVTGVSLALGTSE